MSFTLQEIKDMAEKELQLTPETAVDCSLYFCRLRSKYFNMYRNEIEILRSMNLLKDKMAAEKGHNLRTKGFNGHEIGKFKTDIETYLMLDKEYFAQLRQCLGQELKVEYLEGTITTIDKFTTSIRNYIELKKLQLGIIN